MRLIDADELKVDYIVPSTTTNTSCYQYISKEQIDNASTIDIDPYQKWIPCSERLPEPNQKNKAGTVWKYYLIQDEYGDMHTASCRSKYYDNLNCWVYCNTISVVQDKVVAWMELPELYPYVEERR